MYDKVILDYELNSLAPYLDYETLDIHYNKIYKKLLDNLNKLLKSIDYKFNYSLKYLTENIDMFNLNIRAEILYYLGAVLNHNLYFYNISDKKNILPIGKIKEDINKYFGSFDNFKKEFINKANNLKGSGYTFLVKDSNNKLNIINTSNEDTPYYYGFTPIICLDLWEHAYFTKYKENRELYIDNFFNIIDFQKIENYYKKI